MAKDVMYSSSRADVVSHRERSQCTVAAAAQPSVFEQSRIAIETSVFEPSTTVADSVHNVSSSSRADVVSHRERSQCTVAAAQPSVFQQSRRAVGLRTEYHSRRERSQCRIAAGSVGNVQYPFRQNIPYLASARELESTKFSDIAVILIWRPLS